MDSPMAFTELNELIEEICIDPQTTRSFKGFTTFFRIASDKNPFESAELVDKHSCSAWPCVWTQLPCWCFSHYTNFVFPHLYLRWLTLHICLTRGWYLWFGLACSPPFPLLVVRGRTSRLVGVSLVVGTGFAGRGRVANSRRISHDTCVREHTCCPVRVPRSFWIFV